MPVSSLLYFPSSLLLQLPHSRYSLFSPLLPYVSPKLLLNKLPRVTFFPRRHLNPSSSSKPTLLLDQIPRPRKILTLLVLLVTIFYISALLNPNDELDASSSPSSFSPPSFHLPDFREGAGRATHQRAAGLHSWLKEGKDGSVTVQETDWMEGGHPIRALMAEARVKWEKQLLRQSQTLDQSVGTYKLRYGRSPPKGFDSWWNFTRLHDVLIVDDYDQIHTFISPFLALNPAFLGTRLSELLTKEPFAYELQVRRTHPVNLTGERVKSNRAVEMTRLLDGFRHLLPDGFGEGGGSLGEVGGDDGLVKLSFSDHDLGNKVFWRGSTTGGHYAKDNDFNWRSSHRVRLNALANAHGDSHTDVLVETGFDSDEATRRVSMRRVHARELNEHLFDVGITEVVQCEEEDGTCEEMRAEIELVGYIKPQDTLLYRYALDIDGNGWSSRFRRLVALGQVVFKITIYPEWNTEWLTPWLHYVPVKLDLSDLYHTSTFFISAPGVSEGNEALGKVISEAGLDFVAKHWRWEDLQAYMFRPILEYRRAMAHDRDAMFMGGKMILA